MGGNVDELLDKMHQRILEANAPMLREQGRGEEVFDSPEWQRSAQRMEELYPAALNERQLTGEEPIVADVIDDLDANMPDFGDFMPQDATEPDA